jgi:hypothetical protein
MAVGNPITELSTTGNFVPVTRTLTINGVSYDLSADRSWSIASPGGGSVTSVAMTVPTGFSVSGSPITSAGTLAVTFASGYALPTTVKQSNWDDAYTFVSNFPSQTGNNGKFLYTSGSVLSWQTALQNPMTNYGEMLFAGTLGVISVISPNITTNRQYLQQIGNGTTASAPAWGGIVSTDISGQAITRVNDTNVQITLTGTPGNSVLNAVGLTMGWTGQLAAGRGGTGTSGVSGIMLGNLTAPVTGITGIGGQILRANPSTGVYEFWTPNYLESPFTQLGQIIYSGAGGQPLALNANSTSNNMYLRSVSSGTPAWASIQGGDIVGAGLTSTNDTNVQITLGGTPNNSLLRSVSLTMGWTGQLSVPRGGTGVSTITGVVIGNGTGVMTGVAGTASQLLRRDATNSFYEFFTHNFLSNPMTSLGDIIYGNASGAPIRLAANSTASNLFLRSVSSGTPSWSAIGGGDVTGAAITTANDTNILITASGNTTNALLRTLTLTAGWTGALSPGRGGTGALTLTGVVIGNGIGTMVGVAGTADQLLRRNSANSAYEFFTPTFLSNPMTTLGDIIYGNAAGAPLRLGANATSTNKFLRSVSGGTPSWEEITGFLTGSGTTNYVAKWTPSGTVLGNSQIYDNGTNVGIGTPAPAYKFVVSNANTVGMEFDPGTIISGRNRLLSYNRATSVYNDFELFGNNIILSPSANVGIGTATPTHKLEVVGVISVGNTSATNGSIMLQDNYSIGHLSNIGTMYSGGYLMLGYGVTPSTSSSTSFLSSTGIGSGLSRTAIVVADDFIFYSGSSQVVAAGSFVTTSEKMRLTNAGNLQITTGNLQLNTATNITWGGAYGTDIPTISGTSGSTNGFLQFYPAGSTSGVKMALRRTGQLALPSYTSSSAFTGTSVATLAVTNAGDVITIAPQQVTASGTYTPTWTGLANVTSVTAFSCQYMRVGDTVTVSGWVTIDPVSDNTPTSLSFSLPINSNTSSVNFLNGTGVTQGGGAAASLSGYASNFGEFEVIPSLATAVNYSFHFTYRIV